MTKNRPKNLNLFTIHQPLPAIISILHRVSGIILFLLIPLGLWVFRLSLTSSETFETLQGYLSSPFTKFITWLFLSAFIYHFVAGIRHLLMDIQIGQEKKSGFIAAGVTGVISFLLIVMAGIWLW